MNRMGFGILVVALGTTIVATIQEKRFASFEVFFF